MRAVPIALWITLGGTAVQVGSLFTHFYVHDGARRTAWFGIPMTSELILASALITVALVGLTAAGRSPVSGRSAGAYIGIMATLAVLQVSYRMVAPPFGGQVSGYAGIIGTSCLYYCLPSRALPADLLPGIWAALAGCVLVATGGWLHALWPGHRHAPEYKWGAALQFGITPWLGLAALGAIGQFVFGYTFFTFYTTQLAGAVMRWSGWLPTPHVAVPKNKIGILI